MDGSWRGPDIRIRLEDPNLGRTVRQFEAGEIVAGKYRLQRPLAKGGMGSVWTAQNQQLDVPVAIKFMAPEALASAELRARFEREAKAAAQMRIPQVVQIFEHGEIQGVPFMAMELLEGEDLSARLRNRGRLSLAETARIVNEVCKALRRAHELGIVHRDLKPANVFLARSGDEEVVKVLDFGIAKILGNGSAIEATKTGALIGTPNYMAPEQAHRRNRQVDHRSDLWSLGVIAFRALTGKLPFAGGDPVDILMRIITQPAPPPSEMAPDLGPDVDRFFARALAQEPDHRFQNARDFAEAMNALVPPATQPLAPPWSGAAPARAPSQVSPPRLDVPPPRASRPGDPPAPPAFRGTLPLDTPSIPASAKLAPPRPPGAGDPLDEAATVPIQRSPVGQAYLAAASPQPGPAPAGTPPPGLTRQPSSPRGFGPPGAAAPPPSQQGSGAAWQGSSDPGRKFMSTLPLGTGVGEIMPPGRGPMGSVPEAGSVMAASPSSQAAAQTAAGDSAGTITSAAGEMTVHRPRRTSYVVWAALAAAVLVVLVVGSVVVSAVTATPEPETIPLPPTVAPTLREDSPGKHVVPPATLTPAPPPGGSTPAAVTASSTAAPAPTAKPSVTPGSGAGKPPAPPPRSTGTSAILTRPVFGP